MKKPHAWLGIAASRWLLGGTLLVLSVVSFVIAVRTASTRDTTALENTLLQFLGIFFGAGFSWAIGDASGRANAEKSMSARVKPAFRRVVRLYEAQGRVVAEVDRLAAGLEARSSNGKVDIQAVVQAFRTIRVQVTEQIGTSNDAMEDWRDLAPNEVKELEERAKLMKAELDDN